MALRIPYSKPTLGKEEDEAVLRVLHSGWLAAGSETEAFEQEFATYIGVKYAIFTNSCTSALKIAYRIVGELGFVGVDYPENTFCATYSAAEESGIATLPRICEHSGKKEVCKSCGLSAQYVKKSLVNRRQISQGTALESVSINLIKARDTLRRLNTNQVNTNNQLVSKRPEVVDSALLSTKQRIGGSSIIGEKLLNVKSAELRKMSSGQIKTISIEEPEKTGGNSVENVTLPTTFGRVNVHFSGVKDEIPCLIEDSAHRIEPNDSLVSLIRCYSFYVTKNMTTSTGGMFVTDNKEVYERARNYWKDGLTTSTHDRATGAVDYEVKIMAGGYDGDDLRAAIGRAQLQKLPEFTRRRNQIRDRYNQAFGQTWLGNHLYPYFVTNEEQVSALRQHLSDVGIGSSYNYPGTGWLGVSLPIYPLLTDEEVDTVIREIKTWKSQLTG